MRPTRAVRAVAVVVMCALPAIGCGREGEQAVDASASASAFCDTSREWAVHEMTPIDPSDPAVAKAHFVDYAKFVDDSVSTAPSEIEGEWNVYAKAFRTKLLPVLEKFHYSYEEVGAKGTDEEKATFDGARDERTEQAFQAILGYEADVCGSQHPPPATDITFTTAKADAMRYCELGGKIQEVLGSALGNGPDASALKGLMEGNELWTATDELAAAAPSEIKDDATKFAAFEKGPHREVVEKYDYDVPKIVLSGTQKDRKVFQYSDASIRDASSRLDAFAEQLCG